VLDVGLERVAPEVRRLVGAAEAEVVERDAAMAGGGQLRDLVAPEVAPGRVPVDEQDRSTVAGTLVHVVQPHTTDVEVIGAIREGPIENSINAQTHSSLGCIPSSGGLRARHPDRPDPQPAAEGSASRSPMRAW